MMKRTFIYKITNLINGKSYIGRTHRDVNKRWSEHKKPSRQTVSALSEAIQKYGADNFKFEVIQTALNPELMERYFIQAFGCLAPNGYNLTTGGEKYNWSYESRQKLSKSKKGVSNLYAKGKPQSKDHINKRISHKRKAVTGTNLKTGNTLEFESATAAGNYFNLSGSNSISQVCLGKRYRACGYVWEFKNEPLERYKPKFYRKDKS